MFPQKISQNIDILARIHGNVFPWQPTIMGNKASYYKSMFQISLPWLYLSFHNACPRHLKSRRDLLYTANHKKGYSCSIRYFLWKKMTFQLFFCEKWKEYHQMKPMSHIPRVFINYFRFYDKKKIMVSESVYEL